MPNISRLLNTISALPELRGRVTAQNLKGMMIHNNQDHIYLRRGEATSAVMLNGGLAEAIGVSSRPLYYTITATPGMQVPEGMKILRETTDLAAGMAFKNPPAEVLFDGGKSYLLLNGNDFMAVTCVYGDPDLFSRGDVIAKGGVRINPLNVRREEVQDRVADAVNKYVRAFIGLGTLGVSRIEGPDMCPFDAGIVMGWIDQIGLRASKELSIELLPLTTSGSENEGYFSHGSWRVTSFSLLECISAALCHRPTVEKFGLDTTAPKPFIIQGFGEVGTGIARLFRENRRYTEKFGFRVDGFSDRSAAFHRIGGFDPALLCDIAQERDEVQSTGVEFLLRNSRHFSHLQPYRLDRDGENDVEKEKSLRSLIFQPGYVLVPAARGYQIRDQRDIACLKVKMLMPAANIVLGTPMSTTQQLLELERGLTSAGILYVSEWLLNFGGITCSKEEIVHRVMAGGLDKLQGTDQRRWLREHVLGGDISDVAWTNMKWALDLWASDAYKSSIGQLMRQRVERIMEKRKHILINWPRSTSMVGNVARLDSAVSRAKIAVMGEDIPATQLSRYREILSMPQAPLEERRVAAFTLGKMRDISSLGPLMRILLSDTENEIMHRNAAQAIGHILEGRGNEFGDVVSEMRTLLGRVRSDGDTSNFERRIWIEWALTKIDGR